MKIYPLDHALIKALSGGEPITVKPLDPGFVDIHPCFRLAISSSHRPMIRGNDGGLWRRILDRSFGKGA